MLASSGNHHGQEQTTNKTNNMAEENLVTSSKVDCDLDAKILVAAKDGELEIVKKMLVQGADVESKCCDESTPLTCAVYNNHLPVARYLVEAAKANTNTQDAFGATPLMYAARNGYQDMVRYLVEEAKANVEARDAHGATALIRASHFGRLEIVKYLVEKAKANVYVANDRERTALEVAEEEGVVEYLTSSCR
mmetsp:Transcript_16715/g.33789  ORF Transcript_16715/g.33789 Transcript_16715/m.33789 type:complete len:193 (-) Transcript_16715:322-900(-)|eukprot:CAMPEP_0167796226 /NCGR_PEP_ID=MMETSP0111_2-20121227/14919_1 /TAXON_ID=91324 /ORGANISM="Lotharella globosa, Strain CCCM811" /LENGTH=192 /DNA_ID=CAMNT_0007690073 /DNA_START=160 /DNA_END=738 /DNA_ORIENTATION=-